MMHRLPFFLVLAAPTLAQKPAEARAFVPEGYRCECFVDFAALDRHEMLDGLRRSPLGLVFGMAEQRMGFAFADLTRLSAYPGVPDDDGRDHGSVAIFEGNHNVGLPNLGQIGNYKAEKLGGTPMLVENNEWSQDDPETYASPRDGLLVVGAAHLVRPVLEGRSKLALPPPDFQSLTSGRGSLAHIVMAMSPRVLRDIPFLDAGMWSAEDPPKFLLLRLRIEEATDGGEATVILDATVRCTGKQGPEVVAKTARDALAAAEKHPRLGALKHLWRKIELQTDGIDVVAHMPLGRPREAAGSLAFMLAPMMFLTTAGAAPQAMPAVQLEAVPVEEEQPAVEPVPSEKPKEKPKGEGEGKG